jgi:hypothetical protein
MPDLLDLPGPSRRIRVEPLRLPGPAVAPREREPDREPMREAEPATAPDRAAPEREPVPA